MLGEWIRFAQGQRTGPTPALAIACLSNVHADAVVLDVADLYGADLSMSQLTGLRAHFTCFQTANLEGSILHGALATGANFSRANLRRADLSRAHLNSASFREAQLEFAVLGKA
jgi:uncharacterized protein YjbI with pentapeptide repeats